MLLLVYDPLTLNPPANAPLRPPLRACLQSSSLQHLGSTRTLAPFPYCIPSAGGVGLSVGRFGEVQGDVEKSPKGFVPAGRCALTGPGGCPAFRPFQ